MNQEQLVNFINVLSEMNPGAMHVLCDLLEIGEVMTIAYLQEKKITGSKLWVAYKACNMNVKTLVENIHSNDKAIIDIINDSIGRGYCGNDVALIEY
jgi:hypothetical protein